MKRLLLVALSVIFSLVFISVYSAITYTKNPTTYGETILPLNQCQQINLNTTEHPNFRNLGWCPSTHSYWYFIQQPLATDKSLIMVEVNFPIKNGFYEHLQFKPKCHSELTGTYNFTSGSLTGFSLECDPNGYPPMPEQTLTYLLTNP